jgi:Transposase
MAEPAMPPEVRSLAGTLRRWRAQILAWHRAKVSNGPTEAFNNLIKRIKRATVHEAHLRKARRRPTPLSMSSDRSTIWS